MLDVASLPLRPFLGYSQAYITLVVDLGLNNAEDMKAADQLHHHVHPLQPSQQSLSTTAMLHSPSFSAIHIGDIVYFGNPLCSYVFLGVTAVHSDTDGPAAYEATYSIPNSG